MIVPLALEKGRPKQQSTFVGTESVDITWGSESKILTLKCEWWFELAVNLILWSCDMHGYNLLEQTNRAFEQKHKRYWFTDTVNCRKPVNAKFNTSSGSTWLWVCMFQQPIVTVSWVVYLSSLHAGLCQNRNRMLRSSINSWSCKSKDEWSYILSSQQVCQRSD